MQCVISRSFIRVFIAFICSFGLPVLAQDLTLKQVVDTTERSEEISENYNASRYDSRKFGDTPLSTMLGMRRANQSGDMDALVSFMDLRYLPEDIAKVGGAELFRKLKIAWSQQHILDLTTLSDDPEGHRSDGLPAYRDLLGTFQLKGRNIPIYLQRVPDGKGGETWKIAQESIAQVPLLWDAFGYHPLAESLSQYLPAFRLLEMENWQFTSLLIILIAGWYLTLVLRWLMLKAVSYSDTYKVTMQRFIRIPLRMFLYFTLVQWAVGYLGLSISARVWLETGTLSYLASIFLSLGVIEFCFAIYASRVDKHDNAIAVIKPLVSTLKIVVVTIIVLNWFDDAGFNITAILTGLGIGSLAIALAAQKTLENIFGAFTLFIARPIKPGDFCKSGDIMGTVEEIGLRSTRIRKLNRSLVYVPNAVFASNNLENYSAIDSRQYSREIRVRLDTTPDQIRMLLIDLRKLILAHPKTLDEAIFVRFEEIERDAFLLNINAYVTTGCIFEYRAIAEDINLRMLQVIREHGVELAIPEQSLKLSKRIPQDEGYAASAADAVNMLYRNDKYPFPDFDESEIDSFKNSLTYPAQKESNNKESNNKASNNKEAKNRETEI